MRSRIRDLKGGCMDVRDAIIEGERKLTGCSTSMLEVLADIGSGAWICCSTTGMMKIGDLLRQSVPIPSPLAFSCKHTLTGKQVSVVASRRCTVGRYSC